MTSMRRLCHNIVQNEDKEIMWELKYVTTNEEPLVVSRPNYKGTWYNVTVEWEIGEIITDLSIHNYTRRHLYMWFVKK